MSPRTGRTESPDGVPGDGVPEGVPDGLPDGLPDDGPEGDPVGDGDGALDGVAVEDRAGGGRLRGGRALPVPGDRTDLPAGGLGARTCDRTCARAGRRACGRTCHRTAVRSGDGHGVEDDARRQPHDRGSRVETQPRVARLVGQHQPQVGRGVVVGQHRGAQRSGVGQVTAAVAEVRRGGGRGVLDVLGVRDPVPVGVDPEHAPGAGDELHRPDGPVPAGVAVPGSVVGVGDRREPVAVEHRAEDRRTVLHVDRSSDEGAGLHLPDRGQQADRQVAGLGRARDRGPVGLQQHVRQVRLHDRARGGAGHGDAYGGLGSDRLDRGRRTPGVDDRVRRAGLVGPVTGRCRGQRDLAVGDGTAHRGGGPGQRQHERQRCRRPQSSSSRTVSQKPHRSSPQQPLVN